MSLLKKLPNDLKDSLCILGICASTLGLMSTLPIPENSLEEEARKENISERSYHTFMAKYHGKQVAYLGGMILCGSYLGRRNEDSPSGLA